MSEDETRNEGEAPTEGRPAEGNTEGVAEGESVNPITPPPNLEDDNNQAEAPKEGEAV